ncbi:MAG: efflux RND transporter periplasmic adaptor subunit [Pseudomonadota bacterium]|nr:efflux RND transporter periplasmic adaptor subunit [Pseudomonadota bacterium]
MNVLLPRSSAPSRLAPGAVRPSGIALIALLGLLGCSGDPAVVPAAQAAVAAPSLRTAVAEGVGYRPTTELTGSLEPIASVQLGFDVPGRIDAILVSRGGSVQKGEAIARLDATVARAQLAQAEAAHKGAAAQLAAGEAAFARVTTLNEAGGVSKQQFTDAEAGVLAGRAGVEQAAAAVQMARTNLGFHTLRAPIDGIVTNGPDNAGMLVGAGTPLFVVEDLSALQFKATAPESASWIRADLPALVLPGTPGAIGGAPAKVVRVIPSLDPATRRIPVEVRIDAPPPSVRAHAFARVRIEAGEDVAAVSVPKGAVVARPDFCVLVTDGTTPRKISVEVLGERDGNALVRGLGLDAGATVIVDPPNGLGE